MKEAMKAKDAVRLRTIRSLRSALMSREIELRSGGTGSISDEEAMTVLQKQAKQRRDSIEQFESAGRDDLKAVEVEELAVIEEYLPKQLSSEEIQAEVRAIAEEIGVSGMQGMGKLMGQAMSRLRGKADGKLVQQSAREVLSQS